MTPVVFLGVAGCQAPVSPVREGFQADRVKPCVLRASRLLWQWDDDQDATASPARSWLQAALEHALVCNGPSGPALAIQVKECRLTRSPEPAKEPASFTTPALGTVVRVSFCTSVGDADAHGFQNRSVEIRVYDEVTLPARFSLHERKAAEADMMQRACMRVLELLQERLQTRFSDLVDQGPGVP